MIRAEMATKEDLSKNDTKSVQVILYNGTVVILYNGTGDTKTDPALEILEIVLLVIVFLISFGTNLFLLVTIASSYTLRRVPFNMLFSNLCAVFLLESLWNMIVAITYVSMDAWKLGSVGCAFSSFMVQLVTLEVTFSVCLMCAEGMVSVWQPFRFQSYLTIKKQIVVIVTMWTAGILLCIPLLVKSMTSRLFPSRYNCASAGHDGFVHALFLTIWCYCLMIAIGFGCLLNLGIRQCKEYRIQRKKNAVNYSNVFMQGDLWTEWVNFKLVAWLSLFYLLFELPYIIIHQAGALKTYPDENEVQNVTLFSPIKEDTPKYETVFTWLRYIYSCLFALLVFIMRKDIRAKFKALFSCCHGSVVRNNSAGPVARHENKKPPKTNKKDSVVPLSLNTPVLYISPDGLCLRQLDSSSKVFNKSSKVSGNDQPKFVSYLCDLDSSFSTDDFTNGSPISLSSETNFERRLSKESEVTLPDMGTISFDNRLSEIPMKDIQVTDFEPEPDPEPTPPPAKKSVRFADTVTIFHTASGRNVTPEWVVSTKKTAQDRKRRGSRIPTRIHRNDSITPWKKELNSTYRVNSPVIEPKVFKQIVNESKLGTGMRANSLPRNNLNNRNKMRRRSSMSPPQWKINKLSN